jgi:hypothetical protein|tara:strand:- start:199 stop:1770 length:1572 start_codon:yes stop_codon:yes gene_type:complete
MAATIELKYYNSFWLKKIKSITDVVDSAQATFVSQSGSTINISPGLGEFNMNVGQKVVIEYGASERYVGYIVKRNNDNQFVVDPEPSPTITLPVSSFTVGPIQDFTNIPKAYTKSAAVVNKDWYIEEARIRGGYNNTTVDFGVKAYAVEEVKEAEIRQSSLIYSGIYNSRTGVNNTNQFSIADSITRSTDPRYGSIQKLYAEDSNLIIFQETKVSRALIDKDAIYTQEGQALQAASNVVIGNIQPYAGEYGIAKNPESFAVYGYRKYFTDASRGAVLRLSMDGITEISNNGMYDFFRDTFGGLQGGKAIGGYDIYNNSYVLSLCSAGTLDDVTVTFDEAVRGWTSILSYLPKQMFSIQNSFFSTKSGSIYKHYTEIDSTGNNVNRSNFYGVQYDSTVTSILNLQPSASKSFKTINYEGGKNWSMTSFETDEDQANPINVFSIPTTLLDMQNSLLKNEFKRKEDKYFANLINISPVNQGEILFGKSISGIKGFYATVKMTATNTHASGSNELFALSSNFSESSY